MQIRISLKYELDEAEANRWVHVQYINCPGVDDVESGVLMDALGFLAAFMKT